jgi:DNA-binding GntR family transcriptional regulator
LSVSSARAARASATPSITSKAASARKAATNKNLAQQTYDKLRFAIVRGQIRPNQRLIEVDLAEEFNVSRTPVRESLQRLSSEGLVMPAKRGWVVRELSLDEIREIYEAREALEGYAAGLAAVRATDKQRDYIRGLIAARDEKLAKGTPRDERVFDNDAFHEAIFEACGNSRLVAQIERNSDYYYNVRVAALYTSEQFAASAQQHSDLAAAVCDGRREDAEAIMRKHVRDALDVIMQHSA